MARGDLKILVLDPATGTLVPGIPRPPQEVTGIDKLVQIVALELLNNGGRSIFNPGKGGGLRALIGGNADYDDASELFADVRITVSRVEESIKSGQVSTTRAASERLSGLQIVDITPDESTLSVNVIIGVINEEQRLAQAQVALK